MLSTIEITLRITVDKGLGPDALTRARDSAEQAAAAVIGQPGVTMVSQGAEVRARRATPREREVFAGAAQPSLPGMPTPEAPAAEPAKPKRPRASRLSESDITLRDTFAAGVRDGAPDEPYAGPRGKVGSTLGPALRVHAIGPDKVPLTGGPLLAWLRAAVAEWRRTADPIYAGGWAPHRFVKWLDSGRAARKHDTSLQQAAGAGQHRWRGGGKENEFT